MGFIQIQQKKRINSFLHYGCIYINKDIWYYKQYYKDSKEIRFFDGIKIDLYNGNVLNKSKAPKTKNIDKYNKKINKLINEYCNKINKIETLPKNNNSDCFICLFNKQIYNNKTYLLIHLKEKYIMKSLIINSLIEKNFLYPDLVYETECKTINNRLLIVKAVKQYFKKYLIKR